MAVADTDIENCLNFIIPVWYSSIEFPYHINSPDSSIVSAIIDAFIGVYEGTDR